MNTNRNNIELKDLLEYMGEKVISHGRRRYKLQEHDSLIIQGSFFVWNSKGIKGNYYTLLKSFYNFGNKEINSTVENFLKDIKKGIYRVSKSISNDKKEYKSLGFKKKDNFNIVKDYLVEKRGLREDVVRLLYSRDLISLDERNNIHFTIRDKIGNIKGSDVIGTGEKRYKANTSDGYGFYIDRREEPKTLYIFESPIDLLSYAQMYGKNKIDERHGIEEGIRFLSLSGVREDILNKYLDENIKELYICTDNDETGQNFYYKIREKYNNLEINRDIPMTKDWNEDLNLLKNRKINEKEKTDMKYKQISLFDSKESENKIEDKSEYLHKSIGIFYYTGSLKSLQFIIDVDNEKEEFTVYNSTNPFSYREYKIPFSKLDILGIEDGDHYTSKLISHKKETVEKKLNDYNIWKKENFSRKISEAQTIYYNNKEYTIWINKYNSITNKYDLFLDPIDENDWERPVIRYSDISELMDKVTFEKEELTKVSTEDKTSNYEEISKDKIKEKTTKKKQKEKGRER